MDYAFLDGFEWNELVAATDTELFHGLTMIIAFGNDGSPFPIGTGFIIKSEGRKAWVMTAAHVLIEVRRLQSEVARHNRTALPIFLPPAKPVDIDPKKLRAVCVYGDKGNVLIVTGLAFDEGRDIAVLTIEPQDADAPNIPAHQFAPDSTLPPIGSPVFVLSFAGLAAMDFVKDGEKRQFTTSIRPKLRVGKVTAHYPDGTRLCKGPCIETSIPVYSGMSGGPVFLSRTDGLMRPIALVCSDPDSDGEQKQDRSKAGASIMALLPVRVSSLNGSQMMTIKFDLTDFAGDINPSKARGAYGHKSEVYLTEYGSVWTLRCFTRPW